MKDVIISITGTQLHSPEEEDSIELVTTGKYEIDDDEIKFSYWESELTGMEGTRTSFAVSPTGVVMLREGSLNSQMVFQEGKKHVFLYDTPFGAATMAINTHRIQNSLGAHGGDIVIDYDVDLDQTLLGRNRFKINVREN
ncbi:MAG: DUF1934 domain-containing protein [Eubacteriales bacterium]|nr:DUF1934 domain-containing protein [Eubacteriales bacterium]